MGPNWNGTHEYEVSGMSVPVRSAAKTVVGALKKNIRNLVKGSPKTVKKAASKKVAKKAGSKMSSSPALGSKKAKKKKTRAGSSKGKRVEISNLTEKEVMSLKAMDKISSELRTEVLNPKVDASGEVICREASCDQLATSGGYCRLHYVKNWKKIKRKELIIKEGKLNKYIEELVSKYPDKYIEAIREDLATDKEFGKVVHDLELDESIDDFEMDSDSVDSLIDSIRRDLDDEGDNY